MKELFRIHIFLKNIFEVQGSKGTARMILFDGNVTSDIFTWVVLPGAVDTQIKIIGDKNKLSARYILDGVDSDRQRCQIFIQNDGIDLENGESIKTIPFILTNSENLKWLENSNVKGEVVGEKDGIIIKIYVDDPNVPNSLLYRGNQ